MITGSAKALIITCFITAIVCAVMPARADEAKIGLAAPLSGSFALLGEQLVKGAQEAHKNPATLIITDDSCSAEGGKQAAEHFVQQHVMLVTGFICSEALEAALPVLQQNNIPVVSSGVQELTLTEKRKPFPTPVFRLNTGMDKEIATIGSVLGSLWKQEAFAIIDDGTIEGRELAAGVLNTLKEQQLVPVFTDTYRPGLTNQNALVSRLRRAGASHVFIGGQADDAAAIAQSAISLNYPLVLAGGSLLNAVNDNLPLSTNTYMVAPLAPANLSSAQNFKQEMQARGDIVETYLTLGYASLQIADEAQNQAQEKHTSIADILGSSTFETILGTIRFNQNGTRSDNPNRLHRFNGQVFVPVNP
ncbi:branched-chain amino acid ABC transporter substrate-binding protein [Brucellaceae bacterium C25G]